MTRYRSITLPAEGVTQIAVVLARSAWLACYSESLSGLLYHLLTLATLLLRQLDQLKFLGIMTAEVALLVCRFLIHEKLPGSDFPGLNFVVSVVHFPLWPVVAGPVA